MMDWDRSTANVMSMRVKSVVSKQLSVALAAAVFLSSMPCLPSCAKTADFIDDAIEKTNFLADALHIKKQRDELNSLKARHDPSLQIRINYLQSRIDHKLLVDFFEINSMVAEITDEIEDIDQKIVSIERQRQRTVGLFNIANFATTGTLGVVSNAIDVPAREANTVPAIIAIVGNTASIGLSAAALMFSHTDKKKVKAGSPNVLTYVFDGESVDPMFPLPQVVREYLHRKSEQKTDTRAHHLIDDWRKRGLLQTGSPQEVAEICQTNSPQYTTVAILRRQDAMLRNLRTSLVQTNKGLMKMAEAIDDEEGVDD